MWRHSWAAAVLALLLLSTGCSDDDPEKKPDVLLDRSDVSPLKPSMVDTAQQGSYTGTQYWSCSDNDGFLIDAGWSPKVRDLRSTDDGWALYSAVLDNPDGDAAEELPGIRSRVEKCRKDEGAKLEEVQLRDDDDTYAYRSVTPDGRVDTVRAYAAVGDHRLVQLTLLGLDEESAPDEIERLLGVAVAKAD
jgi:hypothetical protein